MTEHEKEIGGYFGLEQFCGKELYPNAIAVNSGRNALVYLLKARKIRKLYIPYYLCDSVYGVCEREGCPYEYYHIDEHFMPLFDKALDNDEFLYVVNYFGQIGDAALLALQRKHKNIICDNVQAFFHAPLEGIDTLYSCRKFFGVPDGGYVVTDCKWDAPLEPDCSKDRMKHVLGRFEGRASDYYGEFRQNDDMFASLPLRAMSSLTQNILRGVDYDAVRHIREENFKALHEHLSDKNGMTVTCPAGPYAYPFYCENGMEIKRELAKKKIYVATLWPEVIDTDQTWEKSLAENILPLPCDQRYNLNDIKRVVDEISGLI